MYTGIRSHTFNLSAALVTHDKLKHIGHFLLTLCLVSVIHAQGTSVKTYRGSLGDKHIEVRLTRDGNKVTGKYFYDRFKQDIPLEGTYDAKGQLEMVEGSGKRKTGKFICKKEPEAPDVDLECEWSRPDGTSKALVFLTEQGLLLKSDTRLT